MFNAQQRIRQLMDERGWTIYRLAQESKLSQTTISNIFKRNNQPSIPTVNAICDACGITLAQFFAEDDPANTLNARSEFDNSVAALKEDQREALPMYLIENHHEGIVSREKYDAVQAEMARRNAAKSPSKNAVTGMASYASKYALSERLVCGECGTLYRRCTWTRNGEKRVVWRCVSRLDYGKKYCHNSPTLDEAPLQQAILAALNMAMADKNSLIRQITDAMETEIIPFPGGTMSLGDIERRLRELEQQFQTLLEKATDDPAAYGGQFKEILDEQTFLKEKRSGILADNNEQTKANQRIKDAAQTLENASPHITEWDESAIRQLVETVKVLSKDEIAVTLKGGIEICQKIMY